LQDSYGFRFIRHHRTPTQVCCARPSPHHDSPELFYDLRRHPNLRCIATLTCAAHRHPTGTLTCVRRHPT
jgi:hypothetical protein